MKSPLENRSSTAKIALSGIVILALVAGTLVVLEASNITNILKDEQPSSADGPTEAQLRNAAKESARGKQEFLDKTSKESPASPPVPTPVASSNSFTLSAEQSGTRVTVLTKAVDITAGSCVLTVTNGVSTTSQTAKIIYQPEFSSCAGFTVPVSALGPGSWSITVVIATAGGSLTKTNILEVL